LSIDCAPFPSFLAFTQRSRTATRTRRSAQLPDQPADPLYAPESKTLLPTGGSAVRSGEPQRATLLNSSAAGSRSNFRFATTRRITTIFLSYGLRDAKPIARDIHAA